MKFTIYIFTIFISLHLNAQYFNSIAYSSGNIPAVHSTIWIDFDNDGDLDHFLSMNSSTSYLLIMENIGNDNFTLFDSIPSFSTMITTDIDNDGDIDFLTPSIILLNTLPDTIGFMFIQDSCYFLPYFGFYSSLLWADLYNNGIIDIFSYKSYNTSYCSNYLYKNSNLNSCGFILSDSIYGNSYNYCGGDFLNDINNDGYIDIIRIGSGFSFINNGIDSLDKLLPITTNIGLGYYSSQSTLSSDIDNDGYIDIMISGTNLTNGSFNIYKNNHNNTFSEQANIGAIGGIKSNTIIFDYNNDGKQDIMVYQPYSGPYGGTTYNKIKFYKNQGNFSFTMDNSINNIGGTALNLTGGTFKSHSVADYDNDGDLDLFIYGDLPYTPGKFTALYRNDSTPPNTPPTPPNGLYAEMDSIKLILRWQRATDVETPQVTLSYNLMVGTSPKGIDITSPMADTVTGFRRVVELGNAQLNDFYILDKSIFNIGDTVYWSVQTIDNGFGYSPFSQQCTTIICNSLKPQFDTICNNDSLLWQGNYYNTTGDYYQSYGSGAACDSSFNLFLKADSAYLNLQQTDICNGNGGYQWQGNTYYTSGTYNIYNTTTQGCDSIERLILGVHHSFTNLQNEHICMGDSLAFGSNYLKSPGVYNDSLLSAFGCDSLVQLNLDISPEDTLVIQLGDSLIAQSTTALFRWWDCNAQNYIYAANNAVFVPYQNGRYAVEITENGCSYLTGCVEVGGLGFNSASKGEFTVRPNPANHWLTISSDNLIIEKVNIITIQGKQLICQQNLKGNKALKLNISTLATGVYLLQIFTENGIVYRRFIKY